MQFQTPYGKKRYCAKKIECTEDKTLQSHKDACDINKIVATYDKTGTLVNLNQNPMEYGEAPAITLHEALNIVLAAQQEFDAQPSAIRKKFDNDPKKYLDFVHNPDNREEMEALGFLKSPDKPIKVETINPVTEPKEGDEGEKSKV